MTYALQLASIIEYANLIHIHNGYMCEYHKFMNNQLMDIFDDQYLTQHAMHLNKIITDRLEKFYTLLIGSSFLLML